MKSLICAASIACLLVVAAVASRPAGAADDAKANSIEKIMERLHKGKNAPLSVLKTAVKSQSPDWAKIQKQSKTLATVSADLPKFDPPKGDAASFKKLAKAYASNAKDLDTAAKKEDLAETKTALRKIGSSCMGCHDAHKEE
jgi:cytochrome c556